MAASPASTVDRQSSPAEHRPDDTAKTAATSPTRLSSNATDDEILGLTTNIRRRDSTGSQRRDDGAAHDPAEPSSSKAPPASERLALQSAAKVGDGASGDDPALAATQPPTAANTTTEPAHLQAAFDANPELRAAWHDAGSYREAFATPEAARAATGMLADLNRMDALFFSHRPEDHAQLAHAVADLDPVAFASLARAMSQVAQSAGVTFPAIAAHSASHTVAGAKAQEQIPRTASRAPENQGQGKNAREFARDDSALLGVANKNNNAMVSNTPNGVTPAQEQFFHATNAAAVEGVVEAIESQVERLLPEGISKSARNRVVGEIYRELDSTLRANRTLTQQMRDAFRSGALDANHQKAVVSLITGRARQALPAVAKRVLNEWTSTVVSANQQRRERQRTAEGRVDIGGAGGAGNEGRHSMGPRDINYARMSDADILNL
ncbi:MAG: hypothetical protein WCD49_18305 [Candidatus Acidiferrales bacterium]